MWSPGGKCDRPGVNVIAVAFYRLDWIFGWLMLSSVLLVFLFVCEILAVVLSSIYRIQVDKCLSGIIINLIAYNTQHEVKLCYPKYTRTKLPRDSITLTLPSHWAWPPTPSQLFFGSKYLFRPIFSDSKNSNQKKPLHSAFIVCLCTNELKKKKHPVLLYMNIHLTLLLRVYFYLTSIFYQKFYWPNNCLTKIDWTKFLDKSFLTRNFLDQKIGMTKILLT